MMQIEMQVLQACLVLDWVNNDVDAATAHTRQRKVECNCKNALMWFAMTTGAGHTGRGAYALH